MKNLSPSHKNFSSDSPTPTKQQINQPTSKATQPNPNIPSIPLNPRATPYTTAPAQSYPPHDPAIFPDHHQARPYKRARDYSASGLSRLRRKHRCFS
ncbi:hypothetical protein P280DRAFT_472479 [Massarina eburnea CBS 473.64]|uniref:Uncharacterized protein n=1 Tax=Massarina eburnea CBS 473.64 TaxID=1395130 RepID=A0A6A6RNT5_9PLEO|nr:hypothetical protein P280DRAFT_472479 [Massarina eburnea CBS 473.64]